jgi:HEAT repeat protein
VNAPLAQQTPAVHAEGEAAMEPAGIVCLPDLHAPGGGPLAGPDLERSRSFLRGRAQILTQGQVVIGGDPDAEIVVTTRHILAQLGSDDLSKAEAAAYVAGRCRAQDAAADARLTVALRETAKSAGEAIVRIEAAMSLVLRGEAEGMDMLRELAKRDTPFDEPYKAALYLAEAGDPSGWPAFQRALSGTVVGQRLNGVRWVLGFLPFDGKRVGDATIDLRAELVARLRDDVMLVRREVPSQLVRLNPPDLTALLEGVARDDADESVRRVAQQALDAR